MYILFDWFCYIEMSKYRLVNFCVFVLLTSTGKTATHTLYTTEHTAAWLKLVTEQKITMQPSEVLIMWNPLGCDILVLLHF